MAVPTKRLSAADCKAKADDCREMARLALKPEHRIMLQHMAETWDRIASDVSDNNQNN
jgi:hypothetical protein